MFLIKPNLVLLLTLAVLLLAGCDSQEKDQQAPESVSEAQEVVVEPVIEPAVVEHMDPCKDPKNIVTATVTRIELEGGFWGLVGEDNQKYLPMMGIDRALLVEGAKLSFTFDEVTDRQSIYQWGTMVRITNICATEIPEGSLPVDSSEL
jgi:hypothetical protein